MHVHDNLGSHDSSFHHDSVGGHRGVGVEMLEPELGGRLLVAFRVPGLILEGDLLRVQKKVYSQE